jgi:hypothetical protein
VCSVPGYAPLLVRLVQLLCLNNASWDCIADTLRQLPGPVLEFSQQASLPEELSEALDRWVCWYPRHPLLAIVE